MPASMSQSCSRGPSSDDWKKIEPPPNRNGFSPARVSASSARRYISASSNVSNVATGSVAGSRRVYGSPCGG